MITSFSKDGALAGDRFLRERGRDIFRLLVFGMGQAPQSLNPTFAPVQLN